MNEAETRAEYIDPALATGPFITTSNDICGILIYFSIAKLVLGF